MDFKTFIPLSLKLPGVILVKRMPFFASTPLAFFEILEISQNFHQNFSGSRRFYDNPSNYIKQIL